jgi:hypothetical protein
MPARGHSPRTELVARRAPTIDEAHRGADVVFDRRVPGKFRDGVVSVLAYFSPSNDSYTQYGADTDVLWDNVDDVEEWADEMRQHSVDEADEEDQDNADVDEAIAEALIKVAHSGGVGENYARNVAMCDIETANEGMAAMLAPVLRKAFGNDFATKLLDAYEGGSLAQAIQDVLDSADDTGCTDDLTVVSKTALGRLEALANA